MKPMTPMKWITNIKTKFGVDFFEGPAHHLRSQSGVGIMEALVVTVIVALSAVAFLTLSENQSTFLKRTRQTNARDQLGNFFQGVIQDRALLLFSAQHSKNTRLKECLGDAERGIAPKCEIGKPQPLWILDLSDPTLKKVWTAPPSTPALFDEHGQGCEKEKGAYCRFQVYTTFTAYCDTDAQTCSYPGRIVINLGIKQLASTDRNLTPMNLKPVEFTAAHLISYNKPPEVLSFPPELTLSSAQPVKSFNIVFRRERPEFKVIWHMCDSTSTEVMIQCLESNDSDTITITARLATHTSGKSHKARFQLANLGPSPNTSKIVEIPITILPVCSLPWGAFLESGLSVTAYDKPIVGLDEDCKPATLLCDNGTLVGSAKYQNCQRRTPSNCVTPWGEPVPHGQARVAFGLESVPFGMLCPQENRVCTDGKLSGSALYRACTVQPALGCNLPWGGQIGHGEQVVAFMHQQVPFGQSCEATREFRYCQNGLLGGSFNFPNCNQGPPRNCTTPWGAQVGHNFKVPAYQRPSVPFGQPCNGGGNIEERSCNDGLLSGSFGYPSCFVQPPI